MLARIVGAVSDPGGLTKRLTYCAEHFHLVAPQTAAGHLPEGVSIALSAVVIDADRETYSIPGTGDLGLSKVSLDRIGAAAGVTWDVQQSGRLDDGSNPHYCVFRSVGHLRDFDGTVRTIIGTREIDLREGSAQVEGMYERYRQSLADWKAGKSRLKHEPKDPAGQIREIRLHILSHAETKARLRAIRSLGIRTSYSKEELQKPFVVARTMWTGRTDDPELRRTFALEQQRAMLGSTRALYGAEQAPPAAPPQRAPQGTPPPPVGRSTEPFEDDFDRKTGEIIDVKGEPVGRPQKAAETSGAKPSGGHSIPGGKEKGTPISEASGSTLEYWAARIGKELDEGTAKFPDRDRPLCEALEGEIRRRRGEEEPPPDPNDRSSADNEATADELFGDDGRW